MSIAIFGVGILVFLITVYGTVTVGGLYMTRRQLEDQPELTPESATRGKAVGGSDAGRSGPVVPADY